jgi:integrase
MAWSAVDGGRVRFVVAFAGGWDDVVEPLDLLRAELDSVGCRVLLDAGDALGAGIGAMSSPWASSHANATCAGVASSSEATVWTSSTMRRFFSKLPWVKRGLGLRHSSSSSCARHRRPDLQVRCPPARFTGMNPITLMLSSERPKVSLAKRRPIFTPEQIEQTLAAATQPYRTLFTVAALTGARVSELYGLTWVNVRLDDIDDAEITFAWQVDRKGNRRPTKTDGSARTVPIPRELALILARHKHASRDVPPEALVFAARSGRPLSQRNVARALRKHSTAPRTSAAPPFPVLQETATDGRPFQAPAGAVPSMHSFRHTVASRALLAGESVDEVAFLLGHRDATVTRTIYVHEIADARRRQMRRSRMTAEYAGALRIALQNEADNRSS